MQTCGFSQILQILTQKRRNGLNKTVEQAIIGDKQHINKIN